MYLMCDVKKTKKKQLRISTTLALQNMRWSTTAAVTLLTSLPSARSFTVGSRSPAVLPHTFIPARASTITTPCTRLDGPRRPALPTASEGFFYAAAFQRTTRTGPPHS